MNSTLNTVQLLWLHRKTGFVTLIGIIFLGLSISFLNKIHSNYITIRNHSDHLTERLSQQHDLNERFANFQKSQANNPIFALFQHHNLETPVRNSEAEKFLHKYRNALKIEKMKFAISQDTTEIINGITFTKSKIQIDVKVLSDIKFFQFVDRIYKLFPGIVEFQTINIRKNSTPLSQKSNGNTHLFDGQIVFQWIRQKQKS